MKAQSGVEIAWVPGHSHAWWKGFGVQIYISYGSSYTYNISLILCRFGSYNAKQRTTLTDTIRTCSTFSSPTSAA